VEDYKIVRMHDHLGGLDEAIIYYHSMWGRESFMPDRDLIFEFENK